jgi:predicted GH43/DUF377 family glycosyl hydrolase
MKFLFTVFFLMIFIFAFLITNTYAQPQWKKDTNNPVMSGDGAGSWNKHVFWPNVIFNDDSSRFEMWYTASAGPENDWRPQLLGFAVSDDGINWTKKPDAIFGPDLGAWDERAAEGQTVIREKGGVYKMWYSGWHDETDAGGIGYATSTDGIIWIRDGSNPIMVPTPDSWEAGGFGSCHVMPFEGEYKMWYSAWNASYTKTQIGYAFSSDGINWTKESANNPVLKTGGSGQWDDNHLLEPHVLYINGRYHIWYLGRQADDTIRQIGWATSADGIHWNRYDDSTTTSSEYVESDPILKPTPGQWDGNYVQPGTIMVEEDSLHLWYSGSRSPTGTHRWRIGHAAISLDSLLKFTVLGLKDDNHENVPGGYTLLQNFPNPFNPSTTIEFSLPASHFVTLKVYNILGKEISTLVSNKLNQGNHTYTFNGKNLASGIYYYQLTAGEFHQVKKMILLR